MSKELEEGLELQLDFNKLAKAAASSDAILPVAVQNADTKEVILLAYINELAFRESLARREVVLWSTSRNVLWHKGAESGNAFELLEVYVNCEQNSLLFIARPKGGGMCHTRNAAGEARRGCYYRRLNLDTGQLENLEP
jgi:phosphoribosyl-AMP cyclohydrolase